ncbi:hypothetical protein COV22_04385, partial [Candidatus Woesearchaeota archaeon CG10_big_fil_rev_8_21_14_0_10_47_5]
MTWQTILYELVKGEQMDPWDIDISLIAQRYFEMLKKMKELDFRISGKVVLAAAILLKMKTDQLVGVDILELDRLMADNQGVDVGEFYEELEEEFSHKAEEYPMLIPRTPQPRKRKVSIYDLVDALQRALEVKRRRVIRSIPATRMEVPKKRIDMAALIKSLYQRILDFFKGGNEKLTFSRLVPSESREDKVLTFMPLLHLAHIEHR